MSNKAQIEFPHSEYITSWMYFRDQTNEDAETAKWLQRQSAWPLKDDFTLCDIGCGDARIVQKLYTQSRKKFRSILIDPYRAFRELAQNRLRGTTTEITYEDGTSLDFPEYCSRADVSLAIHIVYLLSPSDFEQLLSDCPKDKPLYVIFDSLDSVFSTIWQKTAPDFYNVAKTAHAAIARLDTDTFRITPSPIISELASSKLFGDGKRNLLSMFCYRDLITQSDGEAEKFALETIKKFTRNGKIQCKSTGYEIIRQK